MMIKRLTFVVALLAMMLPLSAAVAEASPITLRLEAYDDLGNLTAVKEVTEGGGGDINLLFNSLTVMGAFGQFNFFSNTGNAVLQPDNLARLTLTAANVSNSLSGRSGSLKMTLTQGGLTTSHTGVAEAVAAVAGSLTGAGTGISVQSWVSGSALPGGTVAAFDPGPATAGAGLFRMTDSALFDLTAAGDFALTTQAIITFNGVGSASLTYSDLKVLPVSSVPEPVSSVPEPGSLLLFGSGLLGLATVIRRKNRGA